MTALSKLIDFFTLAKVDLLTLTQVLIENIELSLFSRIPRLHRLQFIGHLLQLSLFVVVVAASLLQLLQKLNLVLLFNPVELTELI